MKRNRAKTIISTSIMLVISIIFIFPFYTMLMMSSQFSEDINKGIPLLLGGYLIENIKTVFAANFQVFYLNSFIVASFSTIASVFVSTITGYSFAKYKFRFKKQLFSFILITMMVPSQLGLVAFVVEMKQIGWMNTFLPLIIPAAATGFGVYWMKNYIESSLPGELLESGRIDGASEPRILFSISLACIKPAIFALGMMNFVTSWNSFLVPLVILNKISTYTIPIGIVTLNSAYRTDIAARIMALVIGTIPLVIIFISSSKSFISGITMGAIKG
ncbi:MAG: carbohydrate ABC transporter permease [Ruminiclostridium sp.]